MDVSTDFLTNFFPIENLSECTVTHAGNINQYLSRILKRVHQSWRCYISQSQCHST